MQTIDENEELKKPLKNDDPESHLPPTTVTSSKVPDDLDSGFEIQYAVEYSPRKKQKILPPDPKNAWYRDLGTICMIVALLLTFFLGTIMLVTLVFSTNPWNVLALVVVFVVVAMVVIYFEVQSKYMR